MSKQRFSAFFARFLAFSIRFYTQKLPLNRRFYYFSGVISRPGT
jgi:hypothetical protein